MRFVLILAVFLVSFLAGCNKSKPSAGDDDSTLPREGPGDPALTYDEVSKSIAKHRGQRVTWVFVPCSSDGKRMMCALDREKAMGPGHSGIYVVEFASEKEAVAAFQTVAFTPGKTITGTVAGEVEQWIVVKKPGGTADKEIPKVIVPLLLYPDGWKTDAGKDKK